jgi:tetratricopeptide (TPR) repeat protein
VKTIAPVGLSIFRQTWSYVYLLLLVAPGPALAQGAARPNGKLIGWIPQEILERTVSLRQGVGEYHETVTTSSELAQRLYDQGVAYLHSYVWIEAARSFHQALRTDPKMAMAYLGLSYAYSPLDYRAALEALQQAQSHSSGLSDRERRRIQIRVLQLDAMANSGDPVKLRTFREALDGALQAYPQDLEFLLLRGHAEEPTPFGDGQGCVPSAVSYYQRGLTLSPNNFAAHHFLAHCYENQGRFSEALEHAQAYARLAPQIPHAQHMYGHELRCTGRVQEAIRIFLKADVLENEYYRRENIPPDLDWHHAHNLSLLASAYQYSGKIRSAEVYFEQERHLTPFTEYAAFNRKDWPEFLLNRGQFARALDAASEMAQSHAPLARVAGYALASIALVFLQRGDEAGRQLDIAQSELGKLNRADAAAIAPFFWEVQLALVLERGKIADAPPLMESLLRYTRAATSADSWSQGLFRLELLARLARDTGHWEVARELARFMIEYDPYYGGSHYAMALVAQHDGNGGLALTEFGAAAKYWAGADMDFPELIQVKRLLAGAESEKH